VDVGGTSGGLGEFILGFAMTCVGGYLLTNQVTVGGSYLNFYGHNTFGITLIPMVIGVGLLFWNGRSAAGWLLTVAGALFIWPALSRISMCIFSPPACSIRL
jgi:hypothetical protein